MSREFGEYDSGYFHDKLRRCLEDAEGGRTDGAKVMAALLKPLVDMAYTVSSEEACDSGPNSTVTDFAESTPALRQAMRAMEAYTEPARDYAATVLAGVLRQHVTLLPAPGNGNWTARVADKFRVEFKDHEWDVFLKALAQIVRTEKRCNGYWSGSSHHCDTCYTDHHFCQWNDENRVNWLATEVGRLEKENALLRVKLARVPVEEPTLQRD